MATAELSELDRRIIRETQAGLPLCVDPFGALATQLGELPSRVQARFRALLGMGVIRRVAVIPNHYRLGYRYNGMSVWDVEDAEVSKLGTLVGALPFVSHCYLRPRHGDVWPYNLFAMLHARRREEVTAHAEQIRVLLGASCRGSDVLFSSQILKKTGFRMSDSRQEVRECSD